MTKPFQRMPKHIGIIPDGNRRWAAARSLHKKEGYSHGIEPGLRLVDQLIHMGIEEATFYGFTMDNTRRAQDQVKAFSSACVEAVGAISKRSVSLIVVGNTDSKFFPDPLIPYTKSRTECPKGDRRLLLNFLVNYDWRWDLSHIAGNRPEDTIASNQISRIDLVIRWGGRSRLSGFLPVQSIYADIFTLEEYWPDFDDSHLIRALEWYQHCDPTLGG